jgi:hypothetical protein
MNKDLIGPAVRLITLVAVFAAFSIGGEGQVTVSVKVTDESGKPLEGVRCRVTGTELWRDGKWELVGFDGRDMEYRTDKDGRFQLLLGGKVRYDLEFSKGGFGPQFLYQVSAHPAEFQVVMRKGVPVTGRVTYFGEERPCNDAVVVELRLPSRGTWYKATSLVDHAGEFRLLASSPPRPPVSSGSGKPLTLKWQVVCAGEMVEIDVFEGKPVDQVRFEIKVKATRVPAGVGRQDPDQALGPERGER